MSSLSQLAFYRIEASLGSEAFADVYRAQDTVRRRPVRLKVLRREALAPGVSLGRILQEASQASELVHPHLAWVWEAGEADSHYYIAERAVSGMTLAETLARPEPLSLEQVRQILQDIAQGLDFAHARGWTHGQITPQSILLSPELGAVLSDFGLARALRAAGQPDPAAAAYTAPEVWEGSQPTPAADQYALGCILALMLSGKSIFAAPDHDEIQLKQLEFNGAALQEIPEIVWPFSAALERALHPDPARRYPSAGAFASAPQQIADQAGPQERQRLQTDAAARLLALEKGRKDAEEAARQAALEQARREIEEQVRLGSQQRDQQEGQAADAPPGAAASPEDEEIASFVEQRPRRHAARSAPAARRSRLWLFWIGGTVLILLLLSGAWYAGAGDLLRPAPTSTPTLTFAPATPTPSITPSPSPLPTSTFTPSPTSTLTPSASPTRRPSRTPTPSPSGSPIFTATGAPPPAATATPQPEQEGNAQAPFRTGLVARTPWW